MGAPEFPVGSMEVVDHYGPEKRAELITEIERAPAFLRQAVAGLSEDQLEVLYKKWTIRQIANHLADSHINSYNIRFKWALTEDKPVIKAYDENLWSELEEAKTGSLEPSLNLLEGIHKRWVRLLRLIDDGRAVCPSLHPPGWADH
jgi:hypothetical protein